MRVELSNNELNEVNGGSIKFTPEHDMCGLNCTNQCNVLNYDAFIAYIREHMYDMSEKDMLRYALNMNWIERI